MAIVKCPDCSKMISDLAPACIGCGRPMVTPVQSAASVPPVPPPAVQSTVPLSPPPQDAGLESPTSTIVQNKNSNSKLPSWQSLILAIVFVLIIFRLVEIATGANVQGRIVWTVAWMWMSIEAWKFWRWKALLPYPTFLIVSGGVSFVVAYFSQLPVGDFRYKLIAGACNIGGLALLGFLLHRASKKASKDATRPRLLRNMDPLSTSVNWVRVLLGVVVIIAAIAILADYL